MVAVDTNVLVRLITGDNPRQTAVADQFIENGAWVPALAVAEATWVLRAIYKQSHAEIAAAVDMLLAHKNLILQDADILAAALELYKSRPSLGFSDSLMLHVARKAGHLPLGTFDHALGRVEGARRL
jgi:predicted nucleic-acid-binding protein